MKFLGKIKNAIKSISWPTRKALFSDTAFVVGITVIVSMIIFGLSFVADKMVSYFLF